jgi:PAS domain S-box-containing protein
MFKHSLDVHRDGSYWMDSDDRFFYVNDAACKAVGYEREELIGQPLTLINPRATPGAMKNVWERLRADGFFSIESVHRRKDGSEFPVEVTSSYVQFGGKEYHCGFARDISERKQQELDRARLAEQLIQAQKMEAVGRLAGGVAHNFNNILTALVGYCELLLAKLPEDADGHFEAEQIKRATEHATSVTRELLLFSRREAGKPVNLDLNTVVVQTRLLLHQLLRSDIEIVTALAPTVAPVRADRSQIEQVLINLVLNASDAMPNGGAVALETGGVEIEQELVEHGVTLAPGRYVTLTVKDSGVGMDEEIKARIFEPFFSTKGDEKGTGLGLSTVYGIIEESGGRIVVDSKPNAGTRFTIYLPALSLRR